MNNESPPYGCCGVTDGKPVDALVFLSLGDLVARMIVKGCDTKPICISNGAATMKLLLDAVFDPKNFRNEVIWKRANAHNDPKRYGRISDTLLHFYRKWSTHLRVGKQRRWSQADRRSALDRPLDVKGAQTQFRHAAAS